MSPSTISELNKKAYVHIEDWRNRPLQGGRYSYVYVDGIYLRRNWGGEYENVSVLVAIAVNEDGYQEVQGAAEGMKEDKASWLSFFQWLKGRGLDGVKLIIGDKCLGTMNTERASKISQKEAYRIMLRDYPDIMNIEQVCQILNVSTKTGYKLIQDGQLCCVKVGRTYRIPKVHLFMYLCIGARSQQKAV